MRKWSTKENSRGVKWKKLVTDIPENIMKNTVIETDVNVGEGIIFDIKGWDKNVYPSDRKFVTMRCDKDEYYDEEEESFVGIVDYGYDSAEEARKGHKNIVKYLMKHGTYPDDGDEPAGELRKIAEGKIDK